MESSKNNAAQEDLFYNAMMSSLLRLVLRPVLASTDVEYSHAIDDDSQTLADGATAGATAAGAWVLVGKAECDSLCQSSAPVGLNLLRWKAFTRSNRHLLQCSRNTDVELLDGGKNA